MRLAQILCVVGALLPTAARAAAPEADPIIDWPMYHDPQLPTLELLPPVLEPRQRELWEMALGRPDVETRRRAADAIGEAYAAGVPAVGDLAPRLIEMLRDPQLDPLVQLSVARALVRMEARAAADVLLERNSGGSLDMILLTDPALAEWDHAPARRVWLERLAAEDLPQAVRASAAAALGAVGEAAAVEPLRAIALDQRAPAGLRLAAARALARLAPQGLEEAAESLAPQGAAPAAADRRAMLDRLIAAELLSQHRGERAQALLLRLADNREPAVAAVALRRLLEIDPLLLRPIAVRLLGRPDPQVRRLAAEAVVALRTPDAVGALAAVLDDPAPLVRRYVRDRLIELASEPALAQAVRESVTGVLAGDRWRGLEQAALLLGKLDHEPAAQRLIELLDFPRAEVRLASATALRWLAVPETLPPILAHAQRVTQRAPAIFASDQIRFIETMMERHPEDREALASELATLNTPETRDPAIAGRTVEDTGLAMSQLMQMFGLMGYREAEPLMRQWVPQHAVPWTEGRAAAIWSLGLFHAGECESELAGQLVERITDFGFMNPDPEAPNVRQFCAVTLGRMKCVSATAPLEEYAGGDEVGLASRWALEQITGAALEPLPPMRDVLVETFLRPRRLRSEREPIPQEPAPDAGTPGTAAEQAP